MTPSDPILKPCPFCGCAATIKRNKTVMVCCTSCTASTFQLLDDRHSAIAAWNLRGSSTSPSQAAGDALDARFKSHEEALKLLTAGLGALAYYIGPIAVERVKAAFDKEQAAIAAQGDKP